MPDSEHDPLCPVEERRKGRTKGREEERNGTRKEGREEGRQNAGGRKEKKQERRERFLKCTHGQDRVCREESRVQAPSETWKPGRAGLLNSGRDYTFGVALENRAGQFSGGFEHVRI